MTPDLGAAVINDGECGTFDAAMSRAFEAVRTFERATPAFKRYRFGGRSGRTSRMKLEATLALEQLVRMPSRLPRKTVEQLRMLSALTGSTTELLASDFLSAGIVRERRLAAIHRPDSVAKRR